MARKITNVSFKKLEKLVLSNGYTFKRQKGSHKFYDKEGAIRPILIPNYKIIPAFVVKQIIRHLSNQENSPTNFP